MMTDGVAVLFQELGNLKALQMWLRIKRGIATAGADYENSVMNVHSIDKVGTAAEIRWLDSLDDSITSHDLSLSALVAFGFLHCRRHNVSGQRNCSIAKGGMDVNSTPGCESDHYIAAGRSAPQLSSD
jgi:hypothetical protein